MSESSHTALIFLSGEQTLDGPPDDYIPENEQSSAGAHFMASSKCVCI